MALRNAFGNLALDATVSNVYTWLQARLGAKATASSIAVNIANDQTVAVSAASLPLPSGASTAANQTTANTSLSSIDGKLPALSSGRVPVDVGSSINVGEVEVKNDSGNPVPVSAASLPLPSGAATETTLSSVNTKLPSLVSGSLPVLVQNGQLEVTNDVGNPLPVGTAAQLAVSGSASALNTDLISQACGNYRSVAFQITGTWVGTITFQVSNDNTNWVSIASRLSSDLSGPFSATTTVNNAWLALLGGFQYFRLRFTAYTSGTASVSAYFNQESIPVTAAPLSSTPSTITATTSSSATVLSTLNSAATTNATSVKTSAGNLYGISAMNASASTKYVRLFNKASAPTVGTDVPIMVVAIPATSSKEILYVPAMRFSTGIAFAITGGAAATDSTAVAAGDVQLIVSFA